MTVPRAPTPTPWRIRERGADEMLDIIADEGRDVIARVMAYAKTRETAELIVWAVNAHQANLDRITTLEAALADFMDAASRVNDDDPACLPLKAAFANARAALRGAEGTTP